MAHVRSTITTGCWIVVAIWLLGGDAIADPPEIERLPGTDRALNELNSDDSRETSPRESLDDAWRAALATDQRIAASRWNVTSASSTAAAAEAERFPSLKMGSEYYALSDQPAFVAQLPAPLPSAELPFMNSNGVGFQAMVNQPLYTFGRISHGINAADEGVKAYQADFGRTILDVKMNVAEIYIVVLRTQANHRGGRQQGGEPRCACARRGRLLRQGTCAEKRSLGGPGGIGQCPTRGVAGA